MGETKTTSTISSVKSNEDSGYEVESFSDSSTSSSSLDHYSEVCLFEMTDKRKCSKSSNHRCPLRRYNLSGKRINTISSRTFLYLSDCVRHLNLSNNNIINLPETISKLKNLEELLLSHNNLSTIPESWRVLNKLKVLDLSHNKLSNPPCCLESGMERLTHLNLSGNGIVVFSKRPMCSLTLQCLNLSHNCLNMLPLWLFNDQCRSLVELDVSFNFCFDDPSFQSQLPLMSHHRTSAFKSLKKLDICNTGTRLTMVSGITLFNSLQCLSMGNKSGPESTLNHFWEIPVSFFSNPLKIVELHLPKIGLAGLPDDFAKLENLEVLDISKNPIDWLPDSFVRLKSLRDLIMTDCNLSYLPENFSMLRSLRKIVLDKNKLTDVHTSLAGLSNLEWLDLYDNELEELPLSHSHMLSLHMIDLEANYLNLDMVLDVEFNEGKLLDIYHRQRARLRELDIRCSERQNSFKVYKNNSDCADISERFSYCGSDSDLVHADDNLEDLIDDPVTRPTDEPEEEDWDDDSSGNDIFDANLIKRYYLPPGQYMFGWVPPTNRRDCTVPIKLKLNGFVFVPGEAHPKTTFGNRRRIDIEPVAEGQFSDVDVDYCAEIKRTDKLWGLLKEKGISVRNSAGVKCRKCRLCGDYEDCWHHGIWIKF